jgi:hypothetical protein
MKRLQKKKPVIFRRHRKNRELNRRFRTCCQTTSTYSSSFSATTPSGLWPPHCQGFRTTLRHATLGRTHLDLCATRCRGLYLTKHNTQKRQISDLAASEICISLLNIMNSHHFTSWAWSETVLVILYRTAPEAYKTRPGYFRIYYGGSNRRMEKIS